MHGDALGVLGQIIGALTIAIPLIYFAVHIRKQNLDTKASTTEKALQSHTKLAAQLQDPELAEIWLTGMSSVDALSDVDRLRLMTYATAVLRNYENSFVQWRNRKLDNETWFTLLSVVIDLKNSDIYAHILKSRHYQFRPDFIKYINELNVSGN